MNTIEALRTVGFDFEAAEARLSVVQTLLRLEFLQTTTFAGRLDDFACKVSASDLSPSQKVGYFWLAMSGKYLSEYWLERFSNEFAQQPGGPALVRMVCYCTQHQPILLLSSARVELVPLPKDCLAIDVTHTFRYSYNSGIQRVLRKTVSQLLATKRKFQLVVFNESLNALELLSDEQAKNFSVFIKTTVEKKLGRSRDNRQQKVRFREDHNVFYEFLRWLYNSLLALADIWGDSSNTIAGLKMDLQDLARYIVRKQTFSMGFFRARSPLIQKVMVPFENSLLQMEVILELPRIDMFIASKKAFHYKLTMIGYDLIPLTHPEYCVVSGPFVHYLRLIKIADRLSCISHASQLEFEKLLKFLDVSNERPQIVEHTLAGDFSSNESRPPVIGTLPLILSVGTIEPRKNQIGILRAAKSLWLEGLRFRLVFAGSKGWLYESFAQELKEAQQLGMTVEHTVSPAENDLEQLYLDCAFTVFCSLAEGYGLPISESLSFGRPCITSRLGSMKEIAEREGGCIMVDPSSPVELGKAIRQILTDPDLLNRLFNSIKPTQRSSWQHYAEKIYDYSVRQK